MSLIRISQLDIDAAEADDLYKAEVVDVIGKLEKRFGNVKQPWLVRNERKRNRLYTWSFGLNIISAAAGYYGALILMEFIPIPIPYFEYLMALALLGCIELSKRKLSDLFWDSYHSNEKSIDYAALTGNVILFAVSIFLSGFGIFFMATDFSPEAKYTGSSTDPEAIALQDRLSNKQAELDAMLADKGNYNSEGVFYYKLFDERDRLKSSIAKIEDQLTNQFGVILVKNQAIKAEWEIRTGFRKYFGTVITVIAEFLFEYCMYFVALFDWRLLQAGRLKRAKMTVKKGDRLATA